MEKHVERSDSSPQLCSPESLDCCFQLWGPKALDLLHGVLRRATKMTTSSSLTKSPRILQNFAPSWPDVTFCHSYASDHSQKEHISLMDLWSGLIEYFLMLHFQMCRCAYVPIHTLGNSLLLAWCHGRHPLPHHHHHPLPQWIHIIPETAKWRHSSK